MILDSISLRNFGVYLGKQEAILAPPSPNKPIILFGGMNGGGKTTFLDAIQLALYGAKARCSGRGKKVGYRDYLRDMIHHSADPKEGASIEIRFRRTVDGEMRYYRLTRSWWQTVKTIEERVEVFQDAQLDKVLSEHWDEFIESYIPSGIAHLFFFDAEQIKDLAEGEHAAEILGTAVHTLLGLDLVDRLDTDLIALARRKRATSQSTEQARKARQAQEEVDRLQSLVTDAEQEQASLKGTVQRLEKEITDCENKFRQEGGDLFLQRHDIESERKKLETEIATEETLLRELAAGPAPLLLIPSLLEETEKQARSETESWKSAVLTSALEDRDSDVLARLKQDKIPKKYLSQIECLLETDRKDRRGVSEGTIVLNAPQHLPSEIQHLRNAVLPDIKECIEGHLEKVTLLQERLTRCELELARVPTEDAIATIQDELTRVRQRQKEKRAALSAHEDKTRILKRQLEDAEHKFKRDLGNEVEAQVDNEHNARVLKHSARVRETLAKCRVAIIRKHAERLERLVLESFTHLLRKRSLVKDLKINPATFNIELTGSNGKPLPFDRLSAGERQLLATSLLWGLAKASGRPLPTIIDTPLGRLDSSHRRHLLERYFPVASHQVILLSTDEEVDEASLHRLKRHIGRSYTLAFDEKQHSTVINPGYFWATNTANAEK